MKEKSKLSAKFSPTDLFDGCIQQGKSKRYQKAHKSERGLFMDTLFLKIGLQKRAKLSKTSQKK